MKVKKFDEAFKDAMGRYHQNASDARFSDDDYPFKCKYENRIYYVIEIYFKNRSIKCSNGSDEYYLSFDDVEFIPDIFVFSKYNL